MKSFKSLTLLIVFLSSFALAQYPTSPNTGKQNTLFANAQFSATFNGQVSVSETRRNGAGTSSYQEYDSYESPVGQDITVKFLDHDIAVDLSSSNFYANGDFNRITEINGATDVRLIDRSTDVWEGHPFTYTNVIFTVAGKTYTLRSRFIIVNSREALFINQLSPSDLDTANRNQWLDFEYSLRIK
jgi:hypothetical protein